ADQPAAGARGEAPARLHRPWRQAGLGPARLRGFGLFHALLRSRNGTVTQRFPGGAAGSETALAVTGAARRQVQTSARDVPSPTLPAGAPTPRGGSDRDVTLGVVPLARTRCGSSHPAPDG